MNSQNLGITISVNARDGRAQLQGVNGDLLQINQTGTQTAAVFARLGPAVGAALAGMGLAEAGRDLLRTAVQFDSLNKSAAAVTGSAPAAAAQLEFVRNTSKELGLSLLDSAKSFNSLAASAKGTSLEGAGAQQIFIAVARAASALGLSVDEANGALLAIGQMMSKGTVASEELRGQLGERLPGAFQIAARAMGVSTAELGKMLEQGKVVATDFLPKFAAELDKTYSNARFDGIQNNINRLTTSWDTFKASVADTMPFNAAIQTLTALVDSANQAMHSPSRWEEFQGRHAWMKAPVGIASEGFTGAAFNKAAGIRPSSEAYAGAIINFSQFSAGLARASAGPSKGEQQEALKLAEARAKQAHNMRELAAAYEKQILLEGKESEASARSMAQSKAQADAIGWQASASKTAASEKAKLAEKIGDVVAGYDKEITALGMSAREAAGYEAAQKLLISVNAEELRQLQEKPALLETVRAKAQQVYDLQLAQAEAQRRINDFNTRQGIGAGLTMSADRAGRELATMRGLQSGGYYGEKLQREMGIQRAMMDARQQYVDTGLGGAGLDSAMAEAERSIRAAESAQYQLNETLGKTNDLGHAMGMTFSSAFEKAVLGGEDLRGVLAGVLQDIAQIGLRTAVTEPAGKALGSAFSSALGGLFGGGSSSASMDINAPGVMPYENLFANGGIMTSSGRLPLHKYAGGGIANSPQVALFGEGRLPEAYVPLPDGRRIPVAMSGGGGTVVQIIDQRRGGPAIEQQQSIGPDGVQYIRLIVQDEMQRGTVPLVRAGMQNGLFKNEFALYNARRTGQ